jgi:hypothetical protein
MHGQRLWILSLAALAVVGCGGGSAGGGAEAVAGANAGAVPDEGSLRDAFADQLASSSFVREFQREGNELVFLGPDGAGGEATWRIDIEQAAIEPYEDDATPYRGTVTASWLLDDRAIRPEGAESYLPLEFLDRGVAQECWALWDAATGAWTW